MEKYGFVYIWYDRKHKRYYIGCRWGNENDSYICSSKWMKDSYKRRPKDFKRRILSRVYTNKKDVLEEEYKWLSKIKIEELGNRYYNLHNHHFGHWTSEENREIRKKLSLTQTKRMKDPKEREYLRQINLGKKHSEETKQKIGNASKITWNKAKNLGLKRKQVGMIGKKHSEETKQNMSLRASGRTVSEETKKKMSQAAKKRWNN